MNKDENIKKADMDDLFGQVHMENKVEKLTAEEYVVMQLQRAENTINRNKDYMTNIERDNNRLTKNNEALNKIVNFIFKHFEFEFINNNDLYVSYAHIKVGDAELKQLIERMIEEHRGGTKNEII